MTRLVTDWIKDISRNIKDYQMDLEAKCGYDLLGIASRAAGPPREVLIKAAETVKVAVVPVSVGLGVIGEFAENVAGIIEAMGFQCFVTDANDVAGLYEAGRKEAQVVFLADDDAFIAINLKTAYMAENSRCTAAGFVTALEGAAKGLRHKNVLLLGCGKVGSMIREMLLQKGAWLTVYDQNEKLLEKLEQEGCKVLKNIEDIRRFRYIIDATSEGGWIHTDMLNQKALIVSPGVPLSLDQAAYTQYKNRLIHDYLNIGVAAMLGDVIESNEIWRADRIDHIDSKSM